MLTRRGRLALALGGCLYLVAWAFGSEPLYPAAVGLVLAGALAWAWVRLLAGPLELRRPWRGGDHLEGDDVSVALELLPERRLAPGSLVVVDRVRGIGELEATVRGSGRRLGGRYVLRAVPRGRYAFEGALAVLEDPFGLARAELELPASGALVVYPRLVDLDGVFTDSGARSHDGRRLLLRRPSGFDFHSVREYEEGESLRKVHWATTARRGRLMVKELEDAPRDEVAVLLDATAGVAAGSPPDSSFDVQVRAAGSILRAHARRGRRTVLVVNSLERATQSVQAEDSDWHRTLEVLAAAEPNGGTPVASLLSDGAGPAARAPDLTVVTGALAPALVERLVERALGRRAVAVVYVDVASFADPPGRTREPGLVRLQSLGVPVAVVRRGDDLASVLGAAGAGEALAG